MNFFDFYFVLHCIAEEERFIDRDDHANGQKVTLTIRYRFTTSKTKYKGTGAGEDVKKRL